MAKLQYWFQTGDIIFPYNADFTNPEVPMPRIIINDHGKTNGKWFGFVELIQKVDKNLYSIQKKYFSLIEKRELINLFKKMIENGNK